MLSISLALNNLNFRFGDSTNRPRHSVDPVEGYQVHERKIQ